MLNGQGQKAFKYDLDEILMPVERLLSGIELTRECSPRTLDSIISVGERISVAVVSRASWSAACRLSRSTRATLSSPTAPTAPRRWTSRDRSAFAPLAEKWKDSVPVVTGFIGRTRRLLTTLGRNGSDYTATLMAGLLKANAVTVWTDVLGVMTADPALVREAQPVDRLSYDEALELAYFGTRMFHPRTIIPLRECGAALVIRSTTQPEAPGTRIDATGNPDPNRPDLRDQPRTAGTHRRAVAPYRSQQTLGGRIRRALGEAGCAVDDDRVDARPVVLRGDSESDEAKAS